jgi:hypothetical protein
MHLPCRVLLLSALALVSFAQATVAAADSSPSDAEPTIPSDASGPDPDTRALPPYEDYAPSAGSYLVGVDISAARQRNGKLYFNSLRPLYANLDHPDADPVSGKPFVGNHNPGKHTVTLARPGYAVAAIVYHQHLTMVDGYRVVFDRVAGDHFDTTDSYPSPWVGAKGHVVADSHGSLVRGIRATVGNDLHTITLITESPDGTAASASAGSTRPYAYHEPDPAKAPFAPGKLKLPADVRTRLATALADYAAAHDPTPATPKFLGVAIALDPDNRDAVIANAALKRGTFKPATRPATDPAATPAKDLLDAAKLARAAGTPADLDLAACLYDLVLTLQPAQDDALYQSELLRRSTHVPEWAWAVGGPTREPTPAPDSAAATGPKAFAKVQTSINGLCVRTDAAGQEFGQVLEIILTVSPPGPGPQVQIPGKPGKEMHIALDEAIRTVKVRYPNWERKKLIISFDDKYSAKDGGSAGTAFTVLLLSSLEGWDIDPHFAITGDITVDGKVRAIGGVDAKVRGAVADGCSIVAVPAENAERIADYLVLNSPKALADIQIFAAATLADATDLAKAKKPDKLSRAIDLFSEFQSAYNAAPNPAVYLASADAKDKLQNVLEFAPNHLSAKYLLLCADGKQPRKLSVGMSLYRMALATNRFVANLNDARRLAHQQLSDAVFTEAVRQLHALRAITADETVTTLATLTDFVESLQRYNRHGTSLSEVNRRFEAWRLALSKLEANPDTMAKILREGV